MSITNQTLNDDFVKHALDNAIKAKAEEIMGEVIEAAYTDFKKKLANALPEIVLSVQSYYFVEKNINGTEIVVRITDR